MSWVDSESALTASRALKKYFPTDGKDAEVEGAEIAYVAEDDVSEASVFDMDASAARSSRGLAPAAFVPALLGSVYGSPTLHAVEMGHEAWLLQRDLFSALTNTAAPVAMQSPSVDSPTVVADRVIRELGKIADGWAGPNSVAPSSAVIDQVQTILDFLPSNVTLPYIEVEEDDGSVSLRWIADDGTRSFALVFSGNGNVTVIAAESVQSVSRSWTIPIANDIRFAKTLEQASTFGLVTA